MDTGFGLLGALTLRVAGEQKRIPGPKSGLLLAALLLRANEPLTAEQLTTVLWGERRPRTATASLHNHLARLRSLLGPERDRLQAGPGGYLLEVRPGELDAARFTEKLRRAQDAFKAGHLDTAAHESGGARALWRGRPLSGFPSLQESPEVGHLVELHLQAAELHCEARLRQGRYDGLASELKSLTAEFPFQEAFQRQLMLALHRTNRQREALEVFHHLRRSLAEDLGVEPGPAVQEAFREILEEGRGLPKAAGTAPAPQAPHPDPAPAPAPHPAAAGRTAAADPAPGAPAQLPPVNYGFSGRQAELGRLEEIRRSACRRPGAVPVIALSGTGGVGKTSLAVQWAHGIRHDFPDGQLYVNLRGFCPAGPSMSPMEALRQLLDGLGVPHSRIPATRDARSALLRTLTAGRRYLFVFDNARDAEQVRSLLPGTSSSLVLVTSRDQLLGLVAVEGAHPVPLGLMSVEDARELLVNRIGEARAAAEPAALGDIVELTARLPLALAIVAARAAVDTALPLSRLVERLRDSCGLEAFTGHDVLSNVRTVLSWSYQTLSPAAAGLFRLLAVHPGPSITAAAAAGLAGLEPRHALALLDELTQAHLIAPAGEGRHAFHDLLRSYARELGDLTDSAEDRDTALRRVTDHYLYTAQAAARLMDTQLAALELPPLTSPLVRPEAPAGTAGARAWFTAEHAVLMNVIRQSSDEGLDRVCWQLAYTVKTYLFWSGHWHDWADTQTTALGAARRMGDLAAQAHSHRSLGTALRWLGAEHTDDAWAHLHSALGLFAELKDASGQAETHLDLAARYEQHGEAKEALRHNELALEFFRVAGDRGGEAKALNNVGYFHALLGDHAGALARCEEARLVFEEQGDLRSMSLTWDSLGLVHHEMGDYAQAAVCYGHAVEGLRKVGSRYHEAGSLDHLGDAQLATGDEQAARASWRRSLELLEALDHDDAGAVRTKLASRTAG